MTTTRFETGELGSRRIVHIEREDYVATIVRVGTTHLLSWSDKVANNWREAYGSLAEALLRLAVLEECAARGGTLFAQTREEFVESAAQFLEAQTGH